MNQIYWSENKPNIANKLEMRNLYWVVIKITENYCSSFDGILLANPVLSKHMHVIGNKCKKNIENIH